MEHWREMGSGVAKKCNYSHKIQSYLWSVKFVNVD